MPDEWSAYNGRAIIPAGAAMGRLTISLCLVLFAAAAQAAGVHLFTPQGRVDQQTRVSVAFTADMVRLGDATAAAPFDINCGAATGQGRWTDGRTWVYQLPRPLQAGEHCTFTLKPNLTSLGGEGMLGQTRFEFFAGGPWVRYIYPSPNSSIEEDQAFVINAGGPLKPESVERSLWCEADGVGQRIPVRILTENQRKEILAHAWGNFGEAPLVVSCAERLPFGGKMKLVWGKGVEAQNGVKTEKGDSFVFSVREPFRASMSCEREKSSAPCSPLSSVTVDFNSPVEAKWASQVRLLVGDVAKEGVKAVKSGDALWLQTPGESGRQSTIQHIRFSGPFPENADLRIELPREMKDQAGRGLDNAAKFPLLFRTGALPPLAKFPGDFGIVELKEGGVLPVTLRRVETRLPTQTLRLSGSGTLSEQRLTNDAEIIAAMKALSRFESKSRQVKLTVDGETRDVTDPYYARELSFLKGRSGVNRRDLPKPGGQEEFEVVGIPLEKPGFHIVEIESRLLGAALLATPKPMYVRTAALVTNMAVHLKRGRDNALVWVTALDSGKPVGGAEVRISTCDGKEVWRGPTDAQGRAFMDHPLPGGYCGDGNFVFASARLGEDYSFVRSDWNQGIESWRFGVETWGESSEFKIHTIFDRTLLRAGQTVSMKYVARSRNSSGFAVPAAADLPAQAIVRHEETGLEVRLPLVWDAQGTAIAHWKIPESAKRGNYDISFFGGHRNIYSDAQFTVSDFRLPVFTGSIQGVPARQVAPGKVPLALGLSFLNGGAAKNTPVEVSATVRPRWPEYPHYEGFNFQVDFDDQARQAFGIDEGREHEHLVLDRQTLTLDKAGAGKLEVALPDKPKGPSEVYAEMSFTDPNGEVQTIHGTVELWPAAVVLGMSVRDWAAARGDEGSVDVLALDTAGKPLPGQYVKVIGKRRIEYSHRRRIIGGFYAYENHSEFEDMGEVCSGRTDSRGLLHCAPKADTAGSIYLLAEARDDRGNTARATGSFWVTGRGDTWFTAGNQDRIDVVPEKRSYKPGETARLQVRTPFREATALISVEAGGIIDTYVQTLSRFNPVIELPVKGEWGPNVYVSVLAVRGRLEPLKWYSFFQWGWREPITWFKEWWSPTQPTAMVDLAKPAYRLGLAELGVGGEGFKLNVDISPEKTEYRPRDEALVRIKATRPDGKPAAAGEVAFAAVDQALLELKSNDSWNLLDSLLQKRAYEVETATAQSQVIGKRHFGKKAVPIGGGGGRGPARELFDTLLTWQPRVRLDANGMATVKVPINDSLTEFKLVGVATAGANFFGTGAATVRTKQDLQMISGLPPLVREKDDFQALVTLRNGTARAMNVAVTARAGDRALETRQVALEPEGAAEVSWTASAPEGVGSLIWDFEAKDQSGAKDRLRITQQVAPAVPVTVQQASFVRVEGKVETVAVQPSGSLPGKGGIEVGLSAKLSTPPPGLKRFFETYPYSCLEQKTSIAVGLHDEKRWRDMTDNLPAYLDGNGLARYFPGDGSGDAVLTAYVLDMAAASGFVLPEEARSRMLQGLTAVAEARIKPKYWSPYDDLLARKLLVLEAITRQGVTEGTPTKLAAALDVEPLRLSTAALIDWTLVVKRLKGLPQREAKLAAAEQEIRNRLSYTGGRLSFTTERSDYWWWMMVSGDSNAFRLIEAVLDEPAWREDLPKLVRGALERQAHGHWFTTTANAWARVSLDAFGRRFEKEPVTGVTKAALGKAVAELRWPAENPAPLSLPWPAKGEGKLSLNHEGSGKPWASIQVLAAIPAGAPRSFGYKVVRKVTPMQEKTPGKVSRGDLWRVSLDVDAEQDMTWVVVSDPVPAGARILGDGDGRDSHIAVMDEDLRDRRLWPTFVERTFEAFHAYYEVVPKGHFRIEYTVRINNVGDFGLPPTRVEAMYAPDVFGETPNGKVSVAP